MRDCSCNGAGGRVIRHQIMRNMMAVINAKYGGGVFPGSDPTPARVVGGIAVPDVSGQIARSGQALSRGTGFDFADGGPVDSDAARGPRREHRSGRRQRPARPA